jgi:PAS domain S-box-containing protein
MGLAMSKQLRRVVLRYGGAAASFALILLIGFGIQRYFSVSIDMTPVVIALMIASAWYGGRGPGLLVAILFELVIDYFTGPPTTLKLAAAVFNRMLLFVSVVLFASARRSAENQLRQQRELLRVTLSSIGDGVISTDINGSVNFINPTAEAMTGWTSDQSSNKQLGEVFHIVDEETGEPVEGPISTVKREGSRAGRARQVTLIGKEDRRISIEESISPIKDKSGKPVGVIVVFRDVSERRRAERDREQLLEREQAARSEAEAANRLKDEFLATVSHELRTPLNAIVGWASMLRTGKVDAGTTVRAFEVVERNARAQDKLIDDLLDMSRIITGKLRLNVQTVDLEPIVQAACDSVHPAADAKGVRLQVIADPNAGPISGDPDRLQQVVWNLLSNAVKFTPKGGRIQVRLQRINSHVEISVSDTGQGVSAEFLPYVFDRFRQADSTLTRAHSGLGLGLAIVRNLVEQHGGTVSASSPGVGQGATFTVKLPVLIAHDTGRLGSKFGWSQTGVSVDGAFDPPQTIVGLRLLVVEDEPDARELIRFILEQCKSDVKTVASVAEALSALGQWEPDVLVSDIEMPGEDGYDLIRKVRSAEAGTGKRMPAVALTAHARVEDRMRALTAGYDAHISKPVEPAEFVTVIATVVRRAEKA